MPGSLQHSGRNAGVVSVGIARNGIVSVGIARNGIVSVGIARNGGTLPMTSTVPSYSARHKYARQGRHDQACGYEGQEGLPGLGSGLGARQVFGLGGFI